MEHKRLYIGASGWTYRDWAGRFYPNDYQAHAPRNAELFRSLLA